MAIWAFINSESKAVNFIESDGVPGYIPDDFTAVEIPANVSYGHGWIWNGSSFDEVAAPVPVPESITRRQCAKQLLALGMINGDEAIAMTRNGTPPAMVQAYLDNMQEPDRTSATIDFAADTYLRSNPLLTALMAANGMTEAQVDEYFIAAAAL